MCLAVGDLPEQGADAVTRFILYNDAEPVYYLQSPNRLTPKEAAGRPPYRRAGLGSRYGGGATIPVCGDCPATPQQNRSLRA